MKVQQTNHFKANLCLMAKVDSQHALHLCACVPAVWVNRELSSVGEELTSSGQQAHAESICFCITREEAAARSKHATSFSPEFCSLFFHYAWHQAQGHKQHLFWIMNHA